LRCYGILAGLPPLVMAGTRVKPGLRRRPAMT
jgi:hypothetical protein